MKNKISVIVPVYNVENYLSECIVSILNQTLKDIEIICVNDGSKDGSLEILENFKKSDSRIKIINKENGGYGSACNTGLKVAQGEYISIVEPDDFIDCHMFEDMYELAKKNDADIVKSSYYDFKDSTCNEGQSITKINWSEQYKMPDGVFSITECPQFLYFHPSIWSCIYKREFLEQNKIRFVEPKGAGWADNPFQVQTLCLAKRIVYTDKPYYYYRLNNPTSSSNIVNISNPFDRSNEVHAFLQEKNITDKNLMAHLYKRELSYVHIVLSGIKNELFEYACSKIKPFVNRMDKEIIYNNEHITDYEKQVYYWCQNNEGIKTLMNNIKASSRGHEVIKTE